MKDVLIRNCISAEMPLLIRMAVLDERNPGFNDADIFYRIDPNGFIIAVSDQKVIGSICAISYGPDFGFIGLHLVIPEFQNSEVEEKLLEVALQKLGDINTGLNCYPSQLSYYSEHGFSSPHKIISYEGKTDGLLPSTDNIVSPFLHPFDLLNDYDKSCFPYDRKNFLMIYLNQPQSLLLGKLKDNKYAGYGISIPTENGFKISPLLADDHETAEHILTALVRHLKKGSHFFIDLPEENVAAVRLAQKLNMKKIRETIRMYSKADLNLSFKNIYSFTNNELG